MGRPQRITAGFGSKSWMATKNAGLANNAGKWRTADRRGRVVVSGSHACFKLGVDGLTYLYNGNDCILWSDPNLDAESRRNVDGILPRDGFSGPRWSRFLRPLSIRDQPIQENCPGNCFAVAVAMCILYDKMSLQDFNLFLVNCSEHSLLTNAFDY